MQQQYTASIIWIAISARLLMAPEHSPRSCSLLLQLEEQLSMTDKQFGCVFTVKGLEVIVRDTVVLLFPRCPKS